MSEFNCNRRDFLGLASLAFAVSASSAAEAPALAVSVFSAGEAPARCLAFDHQGQPIPAAGFERFHLCDQLMRPFTMPIDASSGEVRFTPPAGRPFRIAMPLSVPGFGEVFVYADDGGAGYTPPSWRARRRCC